ncbi:hypothetical protein ACHJH3_06480 [Campylobacter sp. MOP7]|uniref:hypothetical protein n=1 Tax=Campylobacter canis TaxID=3378588 RepID=UPI00387E9BB7
MVTENSGTTKRGCAGYATYVAEELEAEESAVDVGVIASHFLMDELGYNEADMMSANPTLFTTNKKWGSDVKSFILECVDRIWSVRYYKDSPYKLLFQELKNQPIWDLLEPYGIFSVESNLIELPHNAKRISRRVA